MDEDSFKMKNKGFPISVMLRLEAILDIYL